MNIVLIGYRGTGKSAVGQVLAKRLNWPLLNFDRLIVERAGQSIPEIVEAHGWEYFRDIETEVTLECAEKDQCVFDTGGGCILRSGNVDALKRRGVLFWLRASVEVIAARIGDDNQRPSLTGEQSFVDEIAQVLGERAGKYRAAADFVVDTDSLTVEQVAEQVLAHFKGHGEKSRGGAA